MNFVAVKSVFIVLNVISIAKKGNTRIGHMLAVLWVIQIRPNKACISNGVGEVGTVPECKRVYAQLETPRVLEPPLFFRHKQRLQAH